MSIGGKEGVHALIYVFVLAKALKGLFLAHTALKHPCGLSG